MAENVTPVNHFKYCNVLKLVMMPPYLCNMIESLRKLQWCLNSYHASCKWRQLLAGHWALWVKSLLHKLPIIWKYTTLMCYFIFLLYPNNFVYHRRMTKSLNEWPQVSRSKCQGLYMVVDIQNDLLRNIIRDLY